jgi:exonuclease III
VLVGDFNCVDDILDRSQPKTPTRPSNLKESSLSDLVSAFDLVDMWKKLRPADRGHTYHHPRGSSRIDRIYSSPELVEKFSSIDLQLVPICDHLPLEATLSLDLSSVNHKFVRGFWKLNTSVLKEEAFQNTINSFIEN